MKKLNMTTSDLASKNIDYIEERFPNVISESENKNGKIKKVIDFDLLRQALSEELVEDDSERYRLDWPGKKASLLKANTPITSTLRPDRDSSVNFDTTENVFIEGDNFEVLKVLQESYLGKVKMIYIDPPYNTGTAMIYTNDFSKSDDEYGEEIGAVDEDGIRMFKNTDSNGRFHSDWLSMMYERILVSRDLLSEDGFIALAIDHNELHNLTSICDEIFGEENRLGVITVVHKPEGRNQEKFFGTSNEFMLVYAKNRDNSNFNRVIINLELAEKYDQIDKEGNYRLQNFIRLTDGKLALKEMRPNFWYPIFVNSDTLHVSAYFVDGYEEVYPTTKSGIEMSWKTLLDTLKTSITDGNIIAKKDADGFVTIYEKIREDQVIKTHWTRKEYNAIQYGTKVINDLMCGKYFDFPKSIHLIEDILKLTTGKKSIILDFFAGSATTAHAVLNLNAQDQGDRQFIMVQVPEKTGEDSEAYKTGYKYISDISKERIRRAGKKILEENSDVNASREKPLDVGFRVYKTDTTNMKDVYYHPSEIQQTSISDFISNIKEDRNPLDLLTQVILDLGLTLDLSIEKKQLRGNFVYFVAGNALVACFDDKIDFGIVDDIATYEPLKVVFKDASFKEEQDRTNVDTRMKRLSPETIITVL